MAPPGAGQLTGPAGRPGDAGGDGSDAGGPAPRHLLIFGCGYSGRRIGAEARERGWRVTGTTRSADTARELEAEGLGALVLPDDDLEAATARLRPALGTVTDVVVSIPPDDDADGDPALRMLGALPAGAHPALGTVAYLSTTGVYGDRGGGWVDESTDPAPGLERTRRRVAAEEAWRGFADARELRSLTLRLSGIYGPGRSPLDRIRSGQARRIVKPGTVSNRIHVDDIARCTVAALASDHDGVFNLSDDLPAPSAEVTAHAAALLGVEPPPEIAWDDPALSEMARSFFREDRRVGNDRLENDLRIELRFPTYREGLAALAALHD